MPFVSIRFTRIGAWPGNTISLASIKQNPKETVSDYFTRGKDLATKLALIGEGMTQPAVVKNLLFGLRHEFSEEKIKWLHPDKDPKTLEYWVVLKDVEYREVMTKPNTQNPNAIARRAEGQKQDSL